MLRGHSRDDGHLADYCDGTVYKSHGLFSASDSEIPPLEIIAYYDDVEMCNPIGSRAKKHKLGSRFFGVGHRDGQFSELSRNMHF